jgi:hypothetical protein
MKKIFLIFSLVPLAACNNSKNDNNVNPVNNTILSEAKKIKDLNNIKTVTAIQNFTFNVEGKEIKETASILVSKDKDKLSPGNDYFGMITSGSRGDSISGSMVLNFVFDLKPGTYPVVGMSYHRGGSNNSEMYGGILGGKHELTQYKVNLTECTNLGSNGLGGNKWKISGTFDEMVIAAMPMMLLDKTRNHPKEIKIGGGSFSGLTFDDNWEQIVEEGLKRLQKKN